MITGEGVISSTRCSRRTNFLSRVQPIHLSTLLKLLSVLRCYLHLWWYFCLCLCLYLCLYFCGEMWRRVGLAVLDDPVVSWLGESMAASSGSTSPEPTCRLVASQSSQQGRRIWTNKDQPQGSGSGLRTRIRTNNQDQDRGSRIRSSRPQLQDRGLWSPQRSIWTKPELIVSLSPTSVRWHWCQRQPNQVTSDMYGGGTWVV